jgi:thiol-disulfide isomerase/thioredoxin
MRFLQAMIGVAAAALTITGTAHGGEPAPHLAESSFAKLAQPLPYPYDEAANAGAAVDAALGRAKAAHKLLLIDMGGNWCGDCRILAGTMALPDLAPFIARHFVVVPVDVGRFSKNMDVAQRFGAKRPTGVPALLIVDPRSGALLDQGHTEALADARSMNPQALADWLASWLPK